MSRKVIRNSHTRSRAAPNALVFDSIGDHGQPHNQPEVNGSTTSRAVQKSGKATMAGGSSSHGTSGGGEADGDDDVGEEDENEDDDEDGNEFAPSDRTVEAHGDQAGRIDTEQCDSDDEVYNGVDDINDSDADEPEVEKLEERDIIESEEAYGTSKLTTFPGPSSEASDVWEGFDIDNGLFGSDIRFFDEQMGYFEPGLLDDQLASFQSAGAFDDLEPTLSLPPSPPPTRRRVHFNEPIFPPSDSSVTNDEDLNALFNTGQISSMEADMDFDFEDQGNGDEVDGSSNGSSSGYATDYGETTDEDDVPASATTRPQSLIRRPSPLPAADFQGMPSAGSSAPSLFKVPETPVRGPRIGSFRTDPTKPFGMIDSTGDNILVTPPRHVFRTNRTHAQVLSTKTSTANASPLSSQPARAAPLNVSDFDMSDFSNQVPADPMLATGSESMADILLPIGPTSHTRNSSQASKDVFYPLDRISDVSAVYVADDQDEDEDEDDEGLLDVNDFIDFGVDSSDNDTSLPTPISTSPTPTQDLRAHFDKGIAGVLHHGQTQHLQRSRRLSDGALLSEQAFKKGRHAPADWPISPPKKRKMSGGFAPAGPFGPAMNQKLMHHH